MSDPVIVIRYSDDGGRTWSAEQWIPTGAEGDYLKRVELFQQGTSYNRIYELTDSNQRSFTIISAHADISVAAQ